MRHGWLAIAIALILNSACQADIVVESYFVDDPFFSGYTGSSPIGVGPGDQFSEDNFFDTSPDITGQVLVTDPLSLPAGLGDVVITAHMTGETEVEFDLGVNVGDSTLQDASLTATSISIGGIGFDGDADGFSFLFIATTLDGQVLTDLSDLAISTTNTNFSSTNLDGGTFQLDLSSTGGGEAELVFASTTGSHLRSISFVQLLPDVADDQLTFSGSRTLEFTPVPEPAAALVLGGALISLALRRRRAKR